MKKILFTIIFTTAFSLCGFSQAKKPTLMVLPSDNWCYENGCVTEFDNQGAIEKVPDYGEALMTSSDLNLAISKIGEMMAERGFPLKDLNASIKSLKNDAAEESLTTSSDGDSVAESPVDKLKKVAKADIWIMLSYNINEDGFDRSLTFNMQAIDAYTNKQVASASGTGDKTSSSSLAVMLQKAVESHINNFNSQLDAYFDNLFEQGREITLVCRRWSGSDVDFESEFGGEELGFLIEDWVAANTVQGRFSTTDATENRLFFEQVRIPMVNANGRAVDARSWANELRKMLKDKYGIDAKLSIKGLGQAIITIGGK